MRIGVISDIHGNAVALDAVLRELDKQTLDEVVCLGDLAFKGPSPSECVREIQSLGIPCIFGNTDLYLLAVTGGAPVNDKRPAYEPDPDELPYLLWHTERLSLAEIDFLSTLPFEYRLEADGQRLLFVHGTHQDCFSAIQPTDSVDSLDESLRDAEADWLIMGHIHRPFAFRHRHMMLVNAGAIGFSLDGEWRASYSVVDTATKSVCLHRVEYDIGATVDRARQVDFCFSPDWYGDALKRGWWEPIPYSERKMIDPQPE